MKRLLPLTAVLYALMLSTLPLSAQTAYDYSRLQRERLNRGVVAFRTTPDSVCIQWRYLPSEPEDVSFEVFRDGRLIATRGADEPTFLMDYNPESLAAEYSVRPVYKNGRVPSDLKKETLPLYTGKWTLPAHAPLGYIDIPLTPPEGTVSAGSSGGSVTYNANDATMADLDGDGQLEIILKWDPSNSRDNSQSGITSPTILEALRLDGTSLWRVNLGPNIRSGAHYTPFIVADLDGDGRSELLVRTSDGTIDGTGTVLGDPKADHVRHPDTGEYQANGNPREQFRGPGWPDNMDRKARRGGFIYKGPEWVTCFDGRTGKALSTVDYIPERGELRSWGDNYANRSDRFLAACGYLDGEHLSAIFCRGYYTRTVIAAYDFDGKDLSVRWVFDTNDEDKRSYAGQGNHNLRIGDVDGDGCDEITYGSMAVDHDGSPLYNTGFGHGDAIHLTVFYPPTPSRVVADTKSLQESLVEEDTKRSQVSTPLPTREGQGGGSAECGSPLQVWDCHENKRDGSDFRDARTGKVLFQILSNKDVGRCMAADIDPTNPGLEMWSSASGGICNVRGEVIDSTARIPINFGIWWDGDLLRELLDHERVTKYKTYGPSLTPPVGGRTLHPQKESPKDLTLSPPRGEMERGLPFDFTGSSSVVELFKMEGCAFNNGTKSNPALCADVLGDWREEVLCRTADNQHLRLYITPIPTKYRFHTFLAEPVYRHSVTMQNVGYNQPTNVGFYFGAELEGSGLLFRGWQF
ncbi:MAG: rhamnogalacturonan lyase [Bacteroidaceae bacterium]|nr:rhamnogalacturonan lyase [Bacteroidaceae bacterium]